MQGMPPPHTGEGAHEGRPYGGERKMGRVVRLWGLGLHSVWFVGFWVGDGRWPGLSFQGAGGQPGSAPCFRVTWQTSKGNPRLRASLPPVFSFLPIPARSGEEEPQLHCRRSPHRRRPTWRATNAPKGKAWARFCGVRPDGNSLGQNVYPSPGGQGSEAAGPLNVEGVTSPGWSVGGARFSWWGRVGFPGCCGSSLCYWISVRERRV